MSSIGWTSWTSWMKLDELDRLDALDAATTGESAPVQDALDELDELDRLDELDERRSGRVTHGTTEPGEPGAEVRATGTATGSAERSSTEAVTTPEATGGGVVDAAVDDAALIALGRSVLDIEAAAVAALAPRLDRTFAAACRALLDCRGRVVVCGIGKSGHIGAKLAATFASTGTPAFFVHAAEAAHGDIGMLQPGDVVVALSYSGGSDELLVLLPGIRRLAIPLISLCGEPDSALARASDIVLDTHVEREACPLGLAPTSSTSATLAMGDALAIALLGARGFGPEDFARSHPAGRLGRRLLLRVADVMATGTAVPTVTDAVRVADALVEISSKGLGMVNVVDADGRLVGLFTDGDLRRSLERGEDVRAVDVADLMTLKPTTTAPDTLAYAAFETMQARRITSLPVLADDSDSVLAGVVTMHALLAAGVA